MTKVRLLDTILKREVKFVATKAFVLIETAVGKTNDVVASLRGVAGMKSVDAVTGPYDVIAVAEAPNLAAIGELVTKSIHATSGIIRTVTSLAVELS